MKKDFEGILERQVHNYCNQAMGFMHTALRARTTRQRSAPRAAE